MIQSKTYSAAMKIIPDNIFQMSLQARFLALAYPFLGLSGIGNVLIAFVPAGADTLATSLDLISQNRRLTVLVGLFLLVAPFGAYVRLFAAFICESSIFNLSDFACVDPSLIHRG